MGSKARIWVLGLVAFGAGAASVGLGWMLLREQGSREATLYPPGVELSRVEGVSIRRYTPLRTERPDPAMTLSWGGNPLPDIIADLESIPRRQVKQEESVPSGYFEVQATLVNGNADGRARRVRLAMGDAFGITWTREKEQQQAYVIRSLAGKPLGFTPGTTSSRIGLGLMNGEATLHFEGSTMAKVAAYLSDELEIPIFDETRASGTWDGEVIWRPAEPDGLEKALRDKGLGLALEVRNVEVIIVRRR